VATKKQAKNVVEQEAKRLGMPYVTERWLGGTLTNFVTIRRLMKKMSSFDKLMKDAAYQNMAKKEQIMIAREKAKLERLLQGIADTTRLPAALFVVDIKKERIAVKEAIKLGLPVFALTDTNTDPTCIDYPIPSNDDASRSIEIIIKAIGSAIEAGLVERKKYREEGTVEKKETVYKRERNVEKVTSSTEIVQQPVKTQVLEQTSIQGFKAHTDNEQALEAKEEATLKKVVTQKDTKTIGKENVSSATAKVMVNQKPVQAVERKEQESRSSNQKAKVIEALDKTEADITQTTEQQSLEQE